MHGGGHYRTKNSVSTKLCVYWHQNASILADYVQYNSRSSYREDKANWRDAVHTIYYCTEHVQDDILLGMCRIIM